MDVLKLGVRILGLTSWRESAIPVQYRHITLRGVSASWNGTYDVDVVQAKKPGTTYMDQWTAIGYTLSYHSTTGGKQVNLKYTVFLPLVGGTGPEGVTATTDVNGKLSSFGDSLVGWYSDEDPLNTTRNILSATNPIAKVSVQWSGKTETFHLVK